MKSLSDQFFCCGQLQALGVVLMFCPFNLTCIEMYDKIKHIINGSSNTPNYVTKEKEMNEITSLNMAVLPKIVNWLLYVVRGITMEQNEATDDEGDLTFSLLPRFILKSVCFCAGWLCFCLFVFSLHKSTGTYFLEKSLP